MFTMLRLGHFRLLPNAAQLTGLYSFVLVVVRQMHLHAISLQKLHHVSTQGYVYTTSLNCFTCAYAIIMLLWFPFRYLTTRIYSFSFLSTVAVSGLNTIKYFPKCGSVMHLSYSRGFIIF